MHQPIDEPNIGREVAELAFAEAADGRVPVVVLMPRGKPANTTVGVYLRNSWSFASLTGMTIRTMIVIGQGHCENGLILARERMRGHCDPRLILYDYGIELNGQACFADDALLPLGIGS